MRRNSLAFVLPILLMTGAVCPIHRGQAAQTGSGGVRKIEDLVIYKDDKFYSSFPSIVRRPNGELLVAFRRAPERRLLGEHSITHTDPNSYLMLVRSRDGGKSWSLTPGADLRQPFWRFARPLHGATARRFDPLLQLRLGVAPRRRGGQAEGRVSSRELRLPGRLPGPLQGRRPLLARADFPPPTPGETVFGPYGQPVPAYNRGAMCQGKDGRLYWVVASKTSTVPGRPGTHLLISSDGGDTWAYSCPVAADEKVTFNETSLYETPKGDPGGVHAHGGF